MRDLLANKPLPGLVQPCDRGLDLHGLLLQLEGGDLLLVAHQAKFSNLAVESTCRLPSGAFLLSRREDKKIWRSLANRPAPTQPVIEPGAVDCLSIAIVPKVFLSHLGLGHTFFIIALNRAINEELKISLIII